MANEPWNTRGRTDKIGRPTCTKTIPEGWSQGSLGSLGADDGQWTPESYFTATVDAAGFRQIDLSIADLTADEAFSATVWLQRSFDDGTTWLDVESFTTATEKTVQNPTWGVKWRLGIKSSDDYVSGVIGLRLSQV